MVSTESVADVFGDITAPQSECKWFFIELSKELDMRLLEIVVGISH